MDNNADIPFEIELMSQYLINIDATSVSYILEEQYLSSRESISSEIDDH